MHEWAVIVVIGGFAIGAIVAIFIYFIRGIKKSYALTLGENDENDEIIKEGKLAFSNDLKNEDNPYGSDEYELRDAWDKGWKSGERARRKMKSKFS